MKEFIILNAIKNICDSLKKGQSITLRGAWKKLILIVVNDFKRIKTPLGEVTAVVVEKARAKELELEPTDVT